FSRAPLAFTPALLCGSLLCGSLLRHNLLNLLSLVDLTRVPKLHAPCKQLRNAWCSKTASSLFPSTRAETKPLAQGLPPNDCSAGSAVSRAARKLVCRHKNCA